MMGKLNIFKMFLYFDVYFSNNKNYDDTYMIFKGDILYMDVTSDHLLFRHFRWR